MSLFAAYADQAKEIVQRQKNTRNHEWLENSSFKINPVSQVPGTDGHSSKTEKDFDEADNNLHLDNSEVPLEILSETSNSSCESVKQEQSKKHKKKSKRKHRKEKRSKRSKIQETDFSLETKRVHEYLSVSTISRPSVPKYRVKYYLLGGPNFHRNRTNKKKKWKRYFKFIFDKNPIPSDTVITKDTLNKLGPSEADENYTGFQEEEEIKKKTEYFNKILQDEPNNIKVWLDYIAFQDTVYSFEKNFKKGSMAKAQRVLAERKISILEKALFHNPNCEQLWRQRIKVSVGAFPTDELQQQMKMLVEKDQGNIILWQGYIEASQCSMAHCNIQDVTALYSKCLATLHKLRRSALLEKYLLEENILKMLYQCGLFLKQAGLFEQLWSLLQMYLELNLSPTDKSKFDIDANFDEKDFQELEEVVFSSHLPLHELWLRVERLRECCHFLPVKTQDDCGDPQRIVFTDDVVELIHPITMPENIFKFVGIILTLLKIPLLPNRHYTTQALGLDYVHWSLDSIESLLPVFYPLYPIDTCDKNMLADVKRLSVGPQYLRNIPGQDEYLNLILTVLENTADCLGGKDQMALRIWWFRFQRLLIVLEKHNRFKMPQFLKKKIKNGVKSFLKREENRNQSIFYLEYALIEKEVTSTQKCLDILKIASSMNKDDTIQPKNWNDCQAVKCLLHKTLVETIILDESMEKSNKRGAILENLVLLVLQRKIEKVSLGVLMETDTKFRTICKDLLDNFSGNKSLVDHFLPDFFTDFHVCYGWFLYFYKDPLEAAVFLETTLETLEKHEETSGFECEVLFEFYSTILFKHCLENFGSGMFKILDDVLLRAIDKYPNNLFLLSILAKEQMLIKNFGPQWWKIEKILLNSERTFSVIFSVIIFDLVGRDLVENTVDTVTGSQFEMTVSYKNRMLSLFKKITKNDICTRRCGLIWRLYLQFVYSFFSPDLCRKVYYSAVEECPWLKALYIDAAIYIPAELPQIQDLIIEKQLRLHVTPEELDILRN